MVCLAYHMCESGVAYAAISATGYRHIMVREERSVLDVDDAKLEVLYSGHMQVIVAMRRPNESIATTAVAREKKVSKGIQCILA
jgi:hypothetical protein